jgi:hypothetical protein
MTPESIIALATPLAVIIAAVIQKLDARKARVGTEAVRTTLETASTNADAKMASIEATGDKVHVLVNSRMGMQLKIAALAFRRVADLTKHPSDVEAWQMSEKLLRDHEAQQRIVDDEPRHD